MAGAAIVSRVLSATLYASRGTEPILIFGASALFGATAAAASYLAARRATRVDPIVALRVE